MKHFSSVLNMTHFNNQLQQQLDLHKKNESTIIGTAAGQLAQKETDKIQPKGGAG